MYVLVFISYFLTHGDQLPFSAKNGFCAGCLRLEITIVSQFSPPVVDDNDVVPLLCMAFLLLQLEHKSYLVGLLGRRLSSLSTGMGDKHVWTGRLVKDRLT